MSERVPDDGRRVALLCFDGSDEAAGIDRISADIARDKAEHGAVLARTAGFDARTRVARGKPWEAICEVADEIDAEPIVIGSRGLGRAQSALLGSVSSAVVAHARCAVLVAPAHSVNGSGPGRSTWPHTASAPNDGARAVPGRPPGSSRPVHAVTADVAAHLVGARAGVPAPLEP